MLQDESHIYINYINCYTETQQQFKDTTQMIFETRQLLTGSKLMLQAGNINT
jgi:hypothetical protein